jgi:hypothetical protein
MLTIGTITIMIGDITMGMDGGIITAMVIILVSKSIITIRSLRSTIIILSRLLIIIRRNHAIMVMINVPTKAWQAVL